MDGPAENASWQESGLEKVGAEVDLVEYRRQMHIIKSNLTLKADKLLNTSSLKRLEVFINSNTYDIHKEVLSIIDNVNIDPWVSLHLINLVSTHLRNSICNCDLDSLAAVYFAWKDYDRDKFLNMLHQTWQEENITKCKKFFLGHLVPTIMESSPGDSDKKGSLIDLAFMLVPCYPATCWPESEYDKFLVNVNKYIKNISDLRDGNSLHWHRLWMFLVRIFGKKLHNSMSLVNKLLRVVENAFRNSSSEQRIKGYDCWKELIDNVGLDKKHLSSSKQLRLLLTPLKAKFSKQESVIIKRFEVFVYLLEKLQSDGTLILKELLEFCFGDVGEQTDPTKPGHGRSVPQLWIESAKLLFAIIGHSHNEIEHCLPTEAGVRLNSPLVNTHNIFMYYCHIIKSVDECCKILKEVELQHRITILQCFWRSTLNLLFQSSNKKLDPLNLLNKVIVENLMDNDPYSKNIACMIFRVAMDIDQELVHDFVIQNVNPILKIIFSVPLSDHSYYISVTKFCDMIFTKKEPEEKSKIRSFVFRCFTDFKTIENNAHFVAEIWIRLANELDNQPNNKLDFLLWPALYLQHLHDYENMAMKVVEHYDVLVTKYVQKYEEIRIPLFKAYKKLLKNNPLLAGNILTLVALFPRNFEDLEGTGIILEIFSQILRLPFVIQDKDQKIIMERYLKACLEEESGFSKVAHVKSVENLCHCLVHLFENQLYDCLTNLGHFVKVAPDHVKESICKLLPVPLTDILRKETDSEKIAQIDKLLRILESTKVTEPKVEPHQTARVTIGGRAAKIAKLAKNIPTSPPPLRFFGRDVDNLSSVNVKGSQLKNVTPKKNATPPRNKISTPSLMDESSSKFVPIESEVKIVPDNLTEHQKESLKKRRENIPALYEDLSQSQSQSLNCVIRLDKNQNDFEQPKGAESDKDVADDKKLEEPKNVPEPSANEDNKTELMKEDISNLKMQMELKKLKINIVGAEEFFSPSTKRRRKEKIFNDKSKSDSSKKKILSTSSDEITESLRRSTRGTKGLTSGKKNKEKIKKKEELTAGETSTVKALPKQKKKRRLSLPNKLVEPDNITPKENTKKRKRTSPNTDSEDVIESSQETTLLNNSLKSRSFAKRLAAEDRSPLDSSSKNSLNPRTIKKLAVEESGMDKTQSLPVEKKENNVESKDENVQTNEIIEETENQNTEQVDEKVKNSTQSQDTQTQETETYEPDAIYDTQPKLDVPQKTELTQEQKVVSLMDTASLTFSESAPIEDSTSNADFSKAKVMEIIFGDISSNESETQTLDVNEDLVEDAKEVEENEPASPIGSGCDALPSSPVTGDTPNKTSELLNSTSDISPIGSKSSSDDENDTMKPYVPVALKFENDVDAYGSQSPEKGDDASPTSEIPSEKTVQNAEVKPLDVLTQATDEEKAANMSKRSTKFFNMVKGDSPTPRRFFGKRKSGPHISPSVSRIRKLMSGMKPKASTATSSEADKDDLLTFAREIPSPLATPRTGILKRKHSDGDEGLSPCPKRKRVNFSDPCTTSSKVFYKEETYQGRLFELEPPLDIGLFDSDDANDNLTETEGLETEQSLQITNAAILRNDRAIYPRLEHCDEDVTVIVGKVTSPIFANMLTSKLKSSGINTIGDLARQSEVEVNKFPFKTPIIANVFKALDDHFVKFCKSIGQVADPELTERSSSSVSVGNLQTVDVPVLNVEEEFKLVMEKMKTEKIPPDNILKIVLSSIGERNVLSLIKTHCSPQVTDVFDVQKFSDIIKCISDTEGFETALGTLMRSAKSQEECDVALKRYVDKKPLTVLIQERSMDEIQAALWDSVGNGTFQKPDLLDTCFLPFITPNDLGPFFDRLNTVELQRIVLDKLDQESVDPFIDRLLESFPKCKANVLKKFDARNLADAVEEQWDTENLVELFRLLGGKVAGKLSAKALMDLSIEFQRQIPFKD